MQPDRLGTAQWADPEVLAARHSFTDGALWLGRTMPGQKPIGVKDDRHVCLVAGNRSGKGTSVIIPNLLLWPGSVVVVDPTGDNATITAARRGEGDGRCEGMGQSVYVLDPYGASTVDTKYRASFNPLDMIDPQSKTAVSDAERIAASLVPPPKDEERAWAENGARRLLSGLILHVLTWHEFEGRRNLVTVRDLVYRGDHFAKKQLADRGEDLGESAFELLWHAMTSNHAFDDEIAGTGEEFERVSQQAPAQWSGVHAAAISATKFINKEDMRACLASSSFSLRDLRSHTKGVSLYLTIPSRDHAEDFRWLRLLISLVMTEMESEKGLPVCGHPVLMVLDEFAGLQKMDRIETGIAQIAKYGVKLFLVLQNLGQLKSVYGDNWETFLSNCGTKIFFGIDDAFTQDHVSKLIGDTQIVLVEQGVGVGISHSETEADVTGEGHFSQDGEGETRGDTYKRAPLGLRNTAALIRKLSGNLEASDSHEVNRSKGTSWETSHSKAQENGKSAERSWSERIHKRPLVTPEEIRSLFRRIDENENSELFPGMAIGILSGHPDPVMFRRTPYYDDEYFAQFGFGRPVRASRHKSKAPNTSPYVSGQIDLPFDCVTLKILHDQVTAVVGGVDGKIAAIDLRTGALICTVDAEDATRGHPGGGENKYIADAYFFLELAPSRQCFYTMSHSAVLKTWIFDGSFRQLSSAPLLAPHFNTLRDKIATESRKPRTAPWHPNFLKWSNWTCYSGDVWDGVPSGIVDAKISPDGSSILCLTDWFAMFRSDLAGRLRNEPMVVADAFSIEPANADGSEVWIGRDGQGSILHRGDFRTGRLGDGHAVGLSFSTHGIHTLSPRAVSAGGVVLNTQSISPVSSAELRVGLTIHPLLVLPEIHRVLVPNYSMIRFYDVNTMRAEGHSLVGGHADWPQIEGKWGGGRGEIRSLDATRDRKHLASLARDTLRVWNLDTRTPIGGYPPPEKFQRHGLNGVRGFCETANKNLYCWDYDGVAALIDTRVHTCTTFPAVVQPNQPHVVEIGAAAGDADDVHLLSLETRDGRHPSSAKGLVQGWLGIAPPRLHCLRHQVVTSGRKIDLSTVALGDSKSSFRVYPPSSNNSVAVDVGDGRMALLIGGHLAIYDTSTKSLSSGPIDISRPEGASDVGWPLYTELAVSPDRARLFVNGHRLPIRVFDAISLRSLGEIGGTAPSHGLLPWVDSRHVVFSAKLKSTGGGASEDILALADTGNASSMFRLCKGYFDLSPNKVILLGGGTTLAFCSSDQIRLVDLATGRLQDEPLAVHSTNIRSIHVCADRNEVVTVSHDGSARFWSTKGRLGDETQTAVSVLANLEPIGPESLEA